MMSTYISGKKKFSKQQVDYHIADITYQNCMLTRDSKVRPGIVGIKCWNVSKKWFQVEKLKLLTVQLSILVILR